MKIRHFISMCMFLILGFSSALAMMPDNTDNNKRKRDDNGFETNNKKREINKKETSEEETFNRDDYADFLMWWKSNEKQENCNISSSSTQEEEKIIETAPENSPQNNQAFNINNIQNDTQGTSSTPSMAEFHKQINNNLVPKPKKDSDQSKQKIVVNNTQQASDVGKGIFYNFKLDGNKCPYCQKDYSKLFFKKHVDQCSKNLSAVNIRVKKCVNDPYIIKNLDGSYYCSLCKKYVFYFKTHGSEKEHRINVYAGKNVLKKKLEKSLECHFPTCKAVFDDIDALIDHMIDAHRNKNKDGCFFPECPHNGKHVQNLRNHLLCKHTEKDKKFFICPCCEVFTARRLDTIWNDHISSCNGTNVQFKEIIINNYNKNSSSVPVQCAHQQQITNNPIHTSIKDCDYTDFLNWYESESMQEEEEIIEKVPENSSQNNQNFNINNAQNNFQENGLTVPTQAAFNKQINNDLIPKPIIPKAIKEFNCDDYLEWEKSHVVNNIVINGPVSVSIQQQQQQSQLVVSQQKNDFIVIDDSEKSESSSVLSGSQITFLRDCPHCGKSISIESIYEKHVKKCLKKKMAKESLLPINSQKKESIKKNKTQEAPIDDIYVIKKPDGSYYCSICKRSFEDRGCILMHINKSEEHRYNKLFGKNVFKIPLAKKLVCPFSSCNKEFNDIDDFVDHIIGAHVKGKRCPFPQCKDNINVVTNLRTHIARHHTQSDMFYTCPGCSFITCKCSSDIIGNHIPNCDNFKKLVERIIKQNQSQQNNENGFICEK